MYIFCYQVAFFAGGLGPASISLIGAVFIFITNKRQSDRWIDNIFSPPGGALSVVVTVQAPLSVGCAFFRTKRVSWHSALFIRLFFLRRRCFYLFFSNLLRNIATTATTAIQPTIRCMMKQDVHIFNSYSF